MLNFFRNLKLKRIELHPAYKAAVKYLQSAMADKESNFVYNTSSDFKEQICLEVLQQVTSVIQAQNPVAYNRELLVGAVLLLSQFQVLVLPGPNEDEKEPTGLLKRPGITGELKAHLLDLAKKDKDIKDIAYGLDTSNVTDIYNVCLMKCWRYNIYANTLNQVRISLGDCHADANKDWFYPFIAAMCASQERQYRKELDLPDVLGDIDITGLGYLLFSSMVQGGEKYPNFTWYEHMKERMPEKVALTAFFDGNAPKILNA